MQLCGEFCSEDENFTLNHHKTYTQMKWKFFKIYQQYNQGAVDPAQPEVLRRICAVHTKRRR